MPIPRRRPSCELLEQKAFLVSEKSGRSFVYRPTIEKSSDQSKSLNDLSMTLFDNSPSSRVAQLVDDENLTEDMLEEIRTLLNQKLGELRSKTLLNTYLDATFNPN